MAQTAPISFKFKHLNQQGQEEGFLSKKGSFDGQTLVLDDAAIPSAAIIEVDNRGNRMILSVAQNDGDPAIIAFAVTGGSVKVLKEALGIARSAAWAQMHREKLEREGRGHEYREVDCPHCGATIDVTGFRQSPQVSCRFCHTISTIDNPVKEESQYRLCDECGMFSKPRKFTIFYFYFLIAVYGWSSRTTWRCPACMRGEAWKMFFGNLIFVLGVPVAIVQLIRAYGGTDVGALFKGLDSANLKARKGNMEAAIADYRKVLEQNPHAAGVKYNIGLAFARQKQLDPAAKTLDAALNDCCNYQPAANVLAHCYEELGETEKLAALKAEWSSDDDELHDETHDDATPAGTLDE